MQGQAMQGQAMPEAPHYRSFLLRLWRDPGSEQSAWQGEIEVIQSGDLLSVSSLEEAFSVILHATTLNDELSAGTAGHEDPGKEGSSIDNPPRLCC